MRILNVCDERQEAIFRRRAACVAKIAEQRDHIAVEFERLRVPLRTFEAGLRVGAVLRRNAGVISMLGVPLLALAGRRLAGGASALIRMGKKGARWWSLWKVGKSLTAAIWTRRQRR